MNNEPAIVTSDAHVTLHVQHCNNTIMTPIVRKYLGGANLEMSLNTCITCCILLFWFVRHIIITRRSTAHLLQLSQGLQYSVAALSE